MRVTSYETAAVRTFLHLSKAGQIRLPRNSEIALAVLDAVFSTNEAVIRTVFRSYYRAQFIKILSLLILLDPSRGTALIKYIQLHHGLLIYKYNSMSTLSHLASGCLPLIIIILV